MYIDQSTLKYLVNKPMLVERICRWLLLFQEYDFEVVVKLGRLNTRPDHLSQIETGEEHTNLEEGLPDTQPFVVCVMDGNFKDTIHFLTIGTALEGYFVQQNKELMMLMGFRGRTLCRESNRAKDSTCRLWWPTLHQDSKLYCKACDVCERTDRPSWRDEMPLNPQMMLQPFEKWAINFVGPIQPQGKTGARYIIAATEHLTHWVEAQLVKNCMGATATKFLFEHVLMRFGCTRILINDHGTHFLNEMISALTEEFQVYHQKSTPYHPLANETMEAFNNVLENALTKVFIAQRSDWDLCIPVVLWAYRTT
eukprot:PITA_02892